MTGFASLKALVPSQLRKHVLDMAYKGQSVHVACAFSLIEIVSVLYSQFIRAASHADPQRDYLVLSKGHGVMALYAAFCEMGWLDKSTLDEYFKDGSLLRGLSEFDIPGLEVSSGTLGHGLPVAVGIAFGLKKKASSQRVYCIVGDGEMNEGPMWEALLFAAHHKLNNLTVIVDSNDYQAMGKISEVLNMEPFTNKFEAFGFLVKECDGHNVSSLTKVFEEFSHEDSRPQALVARTVKGKGVSFMEAKNEWHYTRLTQESYEKALGELKL